MQEFLSRRLTGRLTSAAAVPEPPAYSGQDGLYAHPQPPAAAAETRCLEGHARATGRLPGPPGQPAVTVFRIEGLVCCTALASAQPSSALRHGAPLAEVISTR